jgi:hypothetical protein
MLGNINKQSQSVCVTVSLSITYGTCLNRNGLLLFL